MLCWQNIVIIHRVKHETRECVLLFCRLNPIGPNCKTKLNVKLIKKNQKYTPVWYNWCSWDLMTILFKYFNNGTVKFLELIKNSFQTLVYHYKNPNCILQRWKWLQAIMSLWSISSKHVYFVTYHLSGETS